MRNSNKMRLNRSRHIQTSSVRRSAGRDIGHVCHCTLGPQRNTLQLHDQNLTEYENNHVFSVQSEVHDVPGNGSALLFASPVDSDVCKTRWVKRRAKATSHVCLQPKRGTAESDKFSVSTEQKRKGDSSCSVTTTTCLRNSVCEPIRTYY
jgi:hypothetical protein